MGIFDRFRKKTAKHEIKEKPAKVTKSAKYLATEKKEPYVNMIKPSEKTYTKEEVRDMLYRVYDAGIDEGIQERVQKEKKEELFNQLLS